MLLVSLSLDHHGDEVKIVHTMLMIFLWLGTPLCKGTPDTELAEPAVPLDVSSNCIRTVEMTT